MAEAPFVAKEMSVAARKFLYACAFWAVAADESIKPAEQEWLISQFGKEGATDSLEEFVALESQAFFDAFDESASALSEAERNAIFPRLEEWLVSCVELDGSRGSEEQRVIDKIIERLDIGADDARTSETSLPPVEPPAAAPAAEAVSVERLFEGHEDEVVLVRVDAAGKQVLTGSLDGEARLWNYESGKTVKRFGEHGMGVTGLAFCPDGKQLLTGDGLGQLRMWNVDSGKPAWSYNRKKTGGIAALDVNRDGRSIATVSDTGLIRLHAIADGAERVCVDRRREGALCCVVFSPDGRRLATGGDDGKVRVWDSAKCTLEKVLDGHTGGVLCVQFSPDGKRLASASRDNTIRLWDAADGRMLKVLEGHSFSVHGVDFSPDGRRLASGAWDHLVKIWDAESGAELLNMESIDARFAGVAFHPDGRHVLAAGSDKTVHVIGLP